MRPACDTLLRVPWRGGRGMIGPLSWLSPATINSAGRPAGRLTRQGPRGRTVDYASARRNMVDGQLRTNRVTDPRVVEAFETVPREAFVPERSRGVAYIDEDLPLGEGRWLMEPMVMARLLQAAEIAPGDSVLTVGAGTGYGAALAARFAGSVVALEEVSSLARRAEALLQELEVANAVVVEGPLREGWAAQAPYEVILIEGAVEEVPKALAEQLAEGGRLVAVVRGDGGVGRAMLYRKDGTVAGRTLFDAATPVIETLRRPPAFVF